MAAKTPESIRIDFVTGAPVRYLPLIERLSAARDRVVRALDGVEVTRLRRPGAAGAPSLARQTGDLVAYVRHGRDRVYRMSWMTDPTLPRFDPATAAEAGAWEARAAHRLRDWAHAALGELADYLHTLPDSSWGRMGTDPEAGRRSILQEVTEIAERVEATAAELEGALDAH